MDTRPKWIVWRSVNSPPQQRNELLFFDSPSCSLVPTLTELSLLREYSSIDKGDTGLLQTALHQPRTASVHTFANITWFLTVKSVYWLRHVRPSVRMELGSHWTDFHEK